MNKELKPCPFCGEQLQVLGKGQYYAHPVNGCILQHLCFEVEDIKSIEARNTRKPIDDIVEKLNFEKGVAFMTLGNTGDEDYDFAYDNVMSYMNKAIDIVKKGGKNA